MPAADIGRCRSEAADFNQATATHERQRQVQIHITPLSIVSTSINSSGSSPFLVVNLENGSWLAFDNKIEAIKLRNALNDFIAHEPAAVLATSPVPIVESSAEAVCVVDV
jgi:hypothetical protein